MSQRVVVKYSVDLLCEGGNCLYLLADGFTIRVVLREASSEKVTVQCPACWGIPSDPDCETCEGRLRVSPDTNTRYRTLTASQEQ